MCVRTHTQQPETPSMRERAWPRSRVYAQHLCQRRLAGSRAGEPKGARPWPGLEREEEEKEEEGSAAQTARRQQTPANSSGHTMANTGGNRRLRQRSDCIRLRSLPRGERTGPGATGTAAGPRSTFTTPPSGISFCLPQPLSCIPAV